MVTAGFLRAVDARTPFDDVKVELEDAPLAEDEFGDWDQSGLRALAEDGAAGSEEKIFYELLSEGGGAAGALAFEIVLGGDLNFVPVEAVVLVEVGVFGGDDGVLEVGRDLAERNEFVALVVGLVMSPGLQAALDVDGGGGRIDPAEGRESERGEGPEKKYADEQALNEGTEGMRAGLAFGGRGRGCGHASEYAGTRARGRSALRG